MATVEIPDKVFFKIGEVSRLTGLVPHVLRYWETEFGAIRPTKSPTGQRVYQRRDIEAILLIKKLLYEERFTIDGARARLKELRWHGETEGEVLPMRDSRAALQALRDDVAVLLDELKNGA